jgi:hypothetical protein
LGLGLISPIDIAAATEIHDSIWFKIKNHKCESFSKKTNKNFLAKATEKKQSSPTGDVSIIIDTQRRTLTVFNDNEPYKTFKVAVGKPDTPSPIGNWKIVRKAKNWGEGFGSRFMLLNVSWGLYGIHGTNKPYSIGGEESAGCIRMFNWTVEEIYPWVKVGTPVTIVGNPFGRLHQPWKVLVNGDNGSDVVLVQERLKKWGYYQGKCDGMFGPATEHSIFQFQKQQQLPVTGQVNAKDYEALGLK